MEGVGSVSCSALEVVDSITASLTASRSGLAIDILRSIVFIGAGEEVGEEALGGVFGIVFVFRHFL